MNLFDMEFVELLERVEAPAKVLEKYKDDPNIYISFTSAVTPREGKWGTGTTANKTTTKIGMNPMSSYDTPIGIYTYPLKAYWAIISDYDRIPFVKEAPYVYVLRPKNPGNVALNSTYSQQDYINDKESLQEIFSKFDLEAMTNSIDSHYDRTPLQSFMSLTRSIARKIVATSLPNGKVPVIWTQIMRRFYDGISDDTGDSIIHGNEPTQAVFWNMAYLKTVDFIDRTKGGKDTYYDNKSKWKGVGSFKRILPDSKITKDGNDLIETDKNGRLIQKYDTTYNKQILLNIYYPSGNLEKEKKGNYTITYSDESNQKNISSEDGDGIVTAFEYHPNDQLKSMTTSDGKYITHYNLGGDVVFKKEGNESTSYLYHDEPNDNKVKLKVYREPGQKIETFYDEKGAEYASLIYDGADNLIRAESIERWPNGYTKERKVEDPNGKILEHEVNDAQGERIYRKDSDGDIRQYIRWPNGGVRAMYKNGELYSARNEDGDLVYEIKYTGEYTHILGPYGRKIATYKNGDLHLAYTSSEDPIIVIQIDGSVSYYTYYPNGTVKTISRISPDPTNNTYNTNYRNGEVKTIINTYKYTSYWNNYDSTARFTYNRVTGAIVLRRKDGKTSYRYNPEDNEHFLKTYTKDGILEHIDDFLTGKRSTYDEYGNLEGESRIPESSEPLYIKYIGLEDKIKNFLTNPKAPKLPEHIKPSLEGDEIYMGISPTIEDTYGLEPKNESTRMKTKFDTEFETLLEMYTTGDGGIDIDRAYELFRDEYMKSTGKAWSKDKFMQRAGNWQFYGDQNGFIAVRPQQSGFVKFVGAAGSDKSKYKGFKELAAKNLPLWGMVDDKIAGLLTKLGFRGPNKLELFAFKKLMTPEKMASVLGGATIESIDGSKVTMTYPDIGTVVKYFVAAPQYWKKIRGNII